MVTCPPWECTPSHETTQQTSMFLAHVILQKFLYYTLIQFGMVLFIPQNYNYAVDKFCTSSKIIVCGKGANCMVFMKKMLIIGLIQNRAGPQLIGIIKARNLNTVFNLYDLLPH